MGRQNLALTSTDLPTPDTYDRYAIAGRQPDGVADFIRNRYAKPDGAGGWVACDFAELFTFTGTAGREYVDADGVTQTAGLNIPRVGHHETVSGALMNVGLRFDDPVETLKIAGTDVPVDTDGRFAVVMEGLVSYADNDSDSEVIFFRQEVDASNSVQARLRTDVATHDVAFDQSESGVMDSVSGGSLTPALNVPFAIASRHSDDALNGAINGVLLTESATVTAIADISTADFEVAPAFNGSLSQLLIFGEDIGDDAILLATLDEPPADFGPELIPNGRLFLGARGNTPPTGAIKAGDLTQYSRKDGGLRIDRNGEAATNTVWPVTVDDGATYLFRARAADLGDGDVEFVITKSGSVTVASGTVTSADNPMVYEVEFTADGTELNVGVRPSGSTDIVVLSYMSLKEKLT